MASPPASPPPGFTEYYDKYHTEKIYARPNLELTPSAIAQTLDEANEFLEDAVAAVESAQNWVDQLKVYTPSEREALKRKAKLAQANLDKNLAQIRLLQTKVAKLEEKPERSLGPPSTGKSAFIKDYDVKSGKRRTKTRRRTSRKQ